jgi:hypothetical protein
MRAHCPLPTCQSQGALGVELRRSKNGSVKVAKGHLPTDLLAKKQTFFATNLCFL